MMKMPFFTLLTNILITLSLTSLCYASDSFSVKSLENESASEVDQHNFRRIKEENLKILELIARANKNDEQAQVELIQEADKIRILEGQKIDFKNWKNILERSELNPNLLTLMLRFNFSLPQEYIQKILQKSLMDNAEAQDFFNVGLLYKWGNGIEQNYEEVVKWYQKAAEKKHVIAQHNLGSMYLKGIDVKKDYREAIKWFQKAVDHGLEKAQYNPGDNLHGKDVEQSDQKTAKCLFQKTVEEKLAIAQLSLGNMYLRGENVEQNCEEAVKWYQKAAEQGLAEAQYNLGLIYEGGLGIEQDYQKAAKWYRKAADQRLAKAQ